MCEMFDEVKIVRMVESETERMCFRMHFSPKSSKEQICCSFLRRKK